MTLYAFGLMSSVVTRCSGDPGPIIGPFPNRPELVPTGSDRALSIEVTLYSRSRDRVECSSSKSTVLCCCELQPFADAGMFLAKSARWNESSRTNVAHTHGIVLAYNPDMNSVQQVEHSQQVSL